MTDLSGPCSCCRGRKYRKVGHSNVDGSLYEPCYDCQRATNRQFSREFPAPGAPLNVLKRLHPSLFRKPAR